MFDKDEIYVAILEGAAITYLGKYSNSLSTEEELYAEHAIKNVHQAYRSEKLKDEEFKKLRNSVLKSIAIKYGTTREVYDIFRYCDINNSEIESIIKEYKFIDNFDSILIRELAKYTYSINKTSSFYSEESLERIDTYLKKFNNAKTPYFSINAKNTFDMRKLLFDHGRIKESEELIKKFSDNLNELELAMLNLVLKLSEETFKMGYENRMLLLDLRKKAYTDNDKKSLVALYNANEIYNNL